MIMTSGGDRLVGTRDAPPRHVAPSNGQRIVLLTGSSLSFNPRACKEAAALARAGHEVYVLGAWLDPTFKAHDERLIERVAFHFIPVIDTTLTGPANALTRLLRRAAHKGARTAYRLTGWQTPRQLGLAIGRMLEAALRLRADLYIAHSESALSVAARLSQRGMRVAVDMEDWFSEDLPLAARAARPVALLRDLECRLLTGGAYASCPSVAMSRALAVTHGCAAPVVIYNAFAWEERRGIDGRLRDRRDPSVPSIHWYSTTLGPDRGLDDLFSALDLLAHDVEVHLRGAPAAGVDQWLKRQIPDRWRQRVLVHPLVHGDELLSRIAEHTIGFAGETADCRSRDLTVTNKILHYLLGGLAVAASDTAGQREVAARAPGAVALYRPGHVRALAEVLNGLLATPERLRAARAAALTAAEQTFCWERQTGVLLDKVAAALTARPADAPSR
jgi:glycosyltransferase involved in cell wall biosynthesis